MVYLVIEKITNVVLLFCVIAGTIGFPIAVNQIESINDDFKSKEIVGITLAIFLGGGFVVGNQNLSPIKIQSKPFTNLALSFYFWTIVYSAWLKIRSSEMADIEANKVKWSRARKRISAKDAKNNTVKAASNSNNH